MKTLLSLALLLGAATAAQANPFRPQAHRPSHFGPPARPSFHRPMHFGYREFHGPRYVVASRPVVLIRAASGGYRDEHGPTVRPDYRGTGALLGAIAGAIIGNNSGTLHQDAWLGAAWGAGVGYVLGAVAETNARVVESRREPAYGPPYDGTPQRIHAAPASAAIPSAPRLPEAQVVQQAHTINNTFHAAPATPMSAVNSMFGR